MEIKKQLIERYLDDLVVEIVLTGERRIQTRNLKKIKYSLNKAKESGYRLIYYDDLYRELYEEYK